MASCTSLIWFNLYRVAGNPDTDPKMIIPENPDTDPKMPIKDDDGTGSKIIIPDQEPFTEPGASADE